MSDVLLQAENMRITFPGAAGHAQAVRGVCFHVSKGEMLGIVGESGSGKSVLMKAIMGILPEYAALESDGIMLGGRPLHQMGKEDYRRLRGNEMAMIFQDPMTALNPLRTVGQHLTEVLRRNRKCSRGEARRIAEDLLGQVGITNGRQRLRQYPHTLSGGLRQRVMIAMALCCSPSLLIADEPTTALDVTIQAQILSLLLRLQQDRGMSVVIITHDLGVVANTCSRVLVMYGGLVVEEGLAEELFTSSRHPYTKALLRANPTVGKKTGDRLPYIPGTPPSAKNPPAGCPFAPRCTRAIPLCGERLPDTVAYSATHRAKCHVTAREGQYGA